MLIKLKDILSPEEELELKKTIGNKALIEALKKVFLSSLYYGGTLAPDRDADPRRNFICQILYNEDMSMDFNIDDKRIGEKTRAVVEAIRMIEQGLREIELLKDKPGIEIDISNPAR
jgi:hypothetical protein